LGIDASLNRKPDGHLLLESVRAILFSGRSDDAISGELADLLGLGLEELDLVSDILSNRNQFFGEPGLINEPTFVYLPPKGKGKETGDLPSAATEGVTYATASDPRSLAPDQVRRRMEEQLQANASRPLFSGTAVSHTASLDHAISRLKLRRAARKTRNSTSRVHFSLEQRWWRCAFSVWK
jgi:antiviral helicase SLH1